MYIIDLTKDHVDLAIAEVKALCDSVLRVQDTFVFVEDLFEFERLTLSKSFFEVISDFPSSKAVKVERYNVSKESEFFSKTISNLKQKDNTLNLSNPEETFAVFEINGQTYFAKKLWSNPKSFLKRHPKSRPGFHPGACVPKFARVLVNLSGIRKGGKILDPFCGTGGFMIESFDCGLIAHGSDINLDMSEKSKANLAFYGMPANVEIKDALEITGSYDAIITEVPFGKTTVLDRSVPDLVSDFLDIARSVTDTIVISLPTGPEYSFGKWKTLFSYDWYLHKSLSKRIVVLKQ